MSKNAKRQLREMRASGLGPGLVRPRPTAALTPEDRIHSMIMGLLGGPGGGPDPHHKLAAAHCVLLLKDLGLRPADEEDVASLAEDSDGDYIAMALADGSV